MRELELMQTLLAEARPAKVSNLDYQAEFAAREAEIEAAERAKAVIVVKEECPRATRQEHGGTRAGRQRSHAPGNRAHARAVSDDSRAGTAEQPRWWD